MLLYNLPYAEHRLAADDLNRWVAAGELWMGIGGRFGLEEISLAHKAVEQALATATS